jgi:drug/metabolite transporter (DMT)-like permease
MREIGQNDRAIEEERALARAALQAEAQRLDRLIGEAHEEVERLRKLTTGGIGLRWVGVPILLFGVAFSTWPDAWAEKWPPWLSPAVLGFLGTCGLAALFCWLILARLRTDSATA